MTTPLLTLALGAFAIGTGEFVIMGLLPNVATDLGVTIPQAGHLISAYALGVVVGAPLLIALSVRLRRKTVLIALMAAFAVGNILSALAPGYSWLMAARFIAGLPHGAFFGVGAVVAGGLVEPSRRTKAIATMFTGLTLSNVVGVPLTTLLGQHLGWRPVFAADAAIGALAAISVSLAVPAQAKASAEAIRLRGELRAFRSTQVWLALGVAMLGGGGLFATFSYIAPMMTNVAGYAPSSVTLILVLFGLGMTAGNLVGARLADRALMPTLYAALTLQAGVAALFMITAHGKEAAAFTVFLFAAASFAVVPALQSRIVAEAGNAPNVASGANQAAFNIANALGAWLGGLVLSAGLGYTAPNAVAAGLALAGLSIAVSSGLLEHRTRIRARGPIDEAPIAPADLNARAR